MKPNILFIVILITCLSIVSCDTKNSVEEEHSKVNDKLSEIMARGTLVVATDANYPPFSMLKKNAPRSNESQCGPDQYTADQMEGFDVEVAKEIAKRLGVESCFVTPAWTLVTSGGWADRWDLHIGMMTITKDRMDNLYFTQPYFSGPGAAYVHKDNTTYTKPEDLSGKKIGVMAGSTYDLYLQKRLEIPGQKIEYRINDPEIIATKLDTDAFKLIAAGDGKEIDAVLMAINPAHTGIQKGVPMKQIGDYLFAQMTGIAIDKKHSRSPISLVSKISEIVRSMHADGTLSRLSQNIIGTDPTPIAAEFDLNSLNQFPQN